MLRGFGELFRWMLQFDWEMFEKIVQPKEIEQEYRYSARACVIDGPRRRIKIKTADLDYNARRDTQ